MENLKQKGYVKSVFLLAMQSSSICLIIPVLGCNCNYMFFYLLSHLLFQYEECNHFALLPFSFQFEQLLTMVWCFLIGDQYKWLERDLANVDRSKTPWLVATWHPPWYSSYKAHYREVECMRVEMEELLYSYGVDIVFNGHVSDNGYSFLFYS